VEVGGRKKMNQCKYVNVCEWFRLAGVGYEVVIGSESRYVVIFGRDQFRW
jgi:hypothetical protein